MYFVNRPNADWTKSGHGYQKTKNVNSKSCSPKLASKHQNSLIVHPNIPAKRQLLPTHFLLNPKAFYHFFSQYTFFKSQIHYYTSYSHCPFKNTFSAVTMIGSTYYF